MTYAGAPQQLAQNVTNDPTVTFRTTNVTVELRDSHGSPDPGRDGNRRRAILRRAAGVTSA